MVTLLVLVALAVSLGGLAWLAVKVKGYYWAEEYDRKSMKKPKLGFQIALTAVGLVLLVIFAGGGVVVIKPTEIGVVENRLIGQVYPLSSGTHIWPFSPRVIPLFTTTSTYNIRNQWIEIGEPPKGAVKPPQGTSETQIYGVQSTSDSPGMPIVFFRARGWAQINLANVAELHKRFGPSYLENWVEQTWISTLKAVQGKHPFDFAKLNREALQTEIEDALQVQLEVQGPDGSIQLVMVSQLAIVDFDYSAKTNAFLDELLKSDYARQQAIQQQLINAESQKAEQIRVETEYLVTKRNAEAEQAKLIAEATGRADAVKLQADAEAYGIKAKYQAESEGIQKVQASLAASSTAYLEYQKTGKWDGKLPMYMLNGIVPFMNLSSSAAATP